MRLVCETTKPLRKRPIVRQHSIISDAIGQLRYLSDLFSQEKSDNYGTCPEIGQLRYTYSTEVDTIHYFST